MKINSVAGLALFLFISLTSLAQAGGGSAIGNGDDVMSHYLEGTRDAIRQTLIRLTIPENQGPICASQSSLNDAQKAECKAFILETLRPMLVLNSSSHPVPFLLRTEPLLVVGPDGKERQVDARTDLGPEGAIEFDFNRTQFYSPLQIFTLMAHEFGHKVQFHGRYTEDNPPTEAFPNGRALIDSAAYALAAAAQDFRILGSYFLLNDRCYCIIDYGGGAQPLGIEGYSPRFFASPKSFDAFETSIGRRPTDLNVFVDEYGRSRLHLRIILTEQNGCRKDISSGRSTRIELVRAFLPQPNGDVPPEEVLNSEDQPGKNPLCEDSPAPLELRYGRLHFSCLYTGSFGQAAE
ncbi:hypothetical protein WDW37_16110 [Bdellovibrionota bacterium FG-1]